MCRGGMMMNWRVRQHLVRSEPAHKMEARKQMSSRHPA